MTVKAFVMIYPKPEIHHLLVRQQRGLQAPSGVLTEHEVLAIEAGKGLLIFALDRRGNPIASQNIGRCNRGLQAS